MDDVTRRLAIKSAAVGAGAVALGASSAHAQEEKAKGEGSRRDAKPATIDAHTRKSAMPAAEAEARAMFQSVPNGALVTSQFGPAPVWLIMDGVRRGYVSFELFTRVHKDGATIHELENVGAIPEGAPFANDLELIQANVGGQAQGPVFLLNEGRKRGFTGAEIFNQYQYDFGKVHPVSPGVLAAIPEDPPIPG